MTLMRDIPCYAFYFAAYDQCKHLFCKSMPAANQFSTLILAGGLAGICAWLPCYPQDVLKSRVQSSSTAMNYEFNLLQRREIWRGFSFCLLRAFPANAVTFIAYEWCRQVLSSNKPG